MMAPDTLLLALTSVPLGGILSLFLFGTRPRRRHVPGLLFHSVLPKPGLEMSHFPLGRFLKLCSILESENYHSLTLNQACEFHDQPPAAHAKRICITFDDGLQSIFDHALPQLERFHLRATIFCIAGHYGEPSSWDVFSDNRHLTMEQIRTLSDCGHEIGSHTCSHAYLPYLEESALRRELGESRKRLEDITGKAVTSISFPFGGWNRRIWDIARETGYCAATLYRGKDPDINGLLPVLGVYQFDTVGDILSRIDTTRLYSLSRARSRMMSHFSRGTPVWKHRKEYVRI